MGQSGRAEGKKRRTRAQIRKELEAQAAEIRERAIRQERDRQTEMARQLARSPFTIPVTESVQIDEEKPVTVARRIVMLGRVRIHPGTEQALLDEEEGV